MQWLSRGYQRLEDQGRRGGISSSMVKRRLAPRSIMERRLQRGIMNPAMIATWAFGLALAGTPGLVDWRLVWIWVKLLLVAAAWQVGVVPPDQALCPFRQHDISGVSAQGVRVGKGGRNTAAHSLSGELLHLVTAALKFWHTRCRSAGDQQNSFSEA